MFHDRYAVALVNSDLLTMGYLPKFTPKLGHFFIKHAGEIKCEVTGSKRCSTDLEQGCLEILAKTTFLYSNKTILEEIKKKLDPLETFIPKHLIH